MSKKLTVRGEGEIVNTNVVGMAASGFTIRNIESASGRLFTDEESRALRRVAVLGPTVVKNLVGQTNPIGLTVRLGGVPFEVVGMTLPKGIDQNGADQDDIIIVPIGTAMRRLLNVTYVESIYVQAKDTHLMGKAESEIRDLLRARHRLL